MILNKILTLLALSNDAIIDFKQNKPKNNIYIPKNIKLKQNMKRRGARGLTFCALLCQLM